MTTRGRASGRRRTSPEVAELIRLAHGLTQAGSRQEDRYWEGQLDTLIVQLLADEEEDALNLALDALQQTSNRTYNALADTIEANCEGPTLGDTSTLLFAVPVLAWSRYQIPGGPIAADMLRNCRVQLAGQVFAKGTRLVLADYLFSPDQMPDGFVATLTLSKALAASKDKLAVDAATLPEIGQFLSDTRYLIGVAQTAPNKPIFRWQEAGGSREEALSQWRLHGNAVLQPLFTGCAFELLLPQGYHTAWREADRLSRPYALQASIIFLQMVLDIEPADIRVVIAPYGERHLDEYRIGLLGKDNEVVHGMVWPLLENEENDAPCVNEIETTLQAAGVTSILILEQLFPSEYCDDCGSPLFPNLEGESVHAQLPDGAEEQSAGHLH